MLKNIIYDLCIVGSGVAGSLTAYIAAKRGLNVIVLEAGSKFDFNKRLEQIQRHQIIGEPLWPWKRNDRDAFSDSSSSEIGHFYPLNRLRVKGVGGSTLHWEGHTVRFNESDFMSESLYGTGVDWPISYDDLEPYYCLAEKELGVSGTPNESDPPRSQPYPMPGFPPGYDDNLWKPAAEKLGISLSTVSHARNSTAYQGRSPCVAYSWCRACPSGAKYSADIHVNKCLSYDNYTLLDNISARRLIRNNNGTIQEIHATGINGESYEIKAKKFVIAAHAIETTRLLLLSNIGNHSDQVGRNLMEHWFASAGGFHEERNYPNRIGFTTMASRHYYDGEERKNRGAIYLEFNQPPRDPLFDKSELWGKELYDHDCQTFGHWHVLSAEIEHLPNPNSRVSLNNNKTDLFGDPIPHIHFALTDYDRRTIESGHEIMSSLLDARGIKDIKRMGDFGKGAHHMGTCRMSNDPENGVVDKHCKVYGTNNLYLAGSSVFPTAGASQPTLTIAALSLRLADHLTGKEYQV